MILYLTLIDCISVCHPLPSDYSLEKMLQHTISVVMTLSSTPVLADMRILGAELQSECSNCTFQRSRTPRLPSVSKDIDASLKTIELCQWANTTPRTYGTENNYCSHYHGQMTQKTLFSYILCYLYGCGYVIKFSLVQISSFLIMEKKMS